MSRLQILPALATAIMASAIGTGLAAAVEPRGRTEAPPPRTRQAPAKPSPAPPPVLEGLVRGPGQKPLEKARVIAMPATGLPGDEPVSTRTDAQGRFKLTLRKGARHLVRAEWPGLAGRTLHDVVPGAPLTIDLAAGGTIEGVVRDGDTGQPAPASASERASPERSRWATIPTPAASRPLRTRTAISLSRRSRRARTR